MISAAVSAATPLTPKNIDKVIKQMTLKEKATMLVGYTFGNSYWGLPTDADPNAGAIVLGAAGNTAKVDRLGIPHTVLADGPAGVHINAKRPGDSNTYYATGYPIGTLLASTWNTDLVQKMGAAMGNEAKEYGVDCLLGPGLNLMRSPLCGRNFEYFSEDPFVSGFIAAAIVNGIQSQGVATSPKHFAANNQESNRTGNNSKVDERTLRELYLKGFEIMVKQSHPWTIMSSYNKINGTFTQEDHWLLEDVLRGEWGYKGIVMTDWTNTRNTAAQVHAGNDLLTPGNAAQINQIIEGVQNGTIKEADVDRNLRRILQYVVKTPRFKGYEYSNKPDLKAHAQLIREGAAEGMVLLKNEGNILPINPQQKVALLGHTSYGLYAGGSGSGDVNKPYTIDLVEGLTKAGIAIDDTMSTVYRKFREYALLEQEAEMGMFSSNGFFPRHRMSEPLMGWNTYVNAASRTDVAIVTIGRSSGEGADREFADFKMNPDELELLQQTAKAFHQAGKKVIVILNVGAAVQTSVIEKYADAILLTWQPGMEAGNSIADVLTGKSYPSGKLTMTIPVNLKDMPSTANFPKDYGWRDDIFFPAEKKAQIPCINETEYAEGLNVGYRYFQTTGAKVSYPFGYGLSYTTFSYSNASVVFKGGKYIAKVTVTNTGNAAGKEAVQLYVTAPKGKLNKPAMELKAFGKTGELKPGESQELTLTFTPYDLASYSIEDKAWITDAGTYTARFAASSADVRQNVEFKASAKKF